MGIYMHLVLVSNHSPGICRILCSITLCPNVEVRGILSIALLQFIFIRTHTHIHANHNYVALPRYSSLIDTYINKSIHCTHPCTVCILHHQGQGREESREWLHWWHRVAAFSSGTSLAIRFHISNSLIL